MSSKAASRETAAAGTWRFIPVAILLASSLIAALSISKGFGGAWGMKLQAFTGFMLCAFALMKLVDLTRFAKGFGMFDLLGRRWTPWCYAYPFCELLLGEAYFTYVAPVTIYSITLGLGLFNALGVLVAVRGGLDRRDNRLTNPLKMPLCSVIMVASIVMIIMASLLLYL